MIVGNFQKKYASVLHLIEDKIRHPYLFQYIDTPYLNEDKLLLLLLTLEQLNLPTPRYEDYAMTTTLLQVALDTHDRVTNTNANQHELKSRQLTVLAGVYYSGLYYKILSESSEVDTIRVLAHAIKTINDKKIMVYQKENMNLETLMERIEVIESALVVTFSERLTTTSWTEFVKNYLFVQRLLQEKKAFLEYKPSVVFEAMQSCLYIGRGGQLNSLSLEQRNKLIIVCDTYIDAAKHKLESVSGQLPIQFSPLVEKVKRLFGEDYMAKSFVEEG